ncbi:MAG: ROK family protein [Spirochaetaceae bacterium]|nr:ROK family protein [Spirochaetaceae bacterium]
MSKPIPESVASRRSSIALLMRNLVNEEALPRAELSNRTQLSRTAVNQALTTLVEYGLVEEAGYGESTGGRRPQMVKLASGAAFTLGAAMSDWTWTMILTDLAGRKIAEEHQAMSGPTPEAAVDALESAFHRIRPKMHGKRVPPVLGLGAPGLIDMNRGFIHSSVNLGWQDVPLADLVSKRLGMEVTMTNRSKTSAIAEAWLAPEGRVSDLVYIHLGLGVPAGIIINGELMRGNHSFAGELGHTTIVPDGPPCPCGNRGCLQELISEDAVRIRAMTMADREARQPKELTAEQVLRAADEGHPVFRRVVRETAGYLAVAVGNLINLLDPDRIVLGGPMVEWSRLLVEETREQVAYRAMRLPLSLTRIEPAALGVEAGALGAALMIRSRAVELILP